MSGWTPAKAAAVRESFEEFRYYVHINSKETGNTVLGENVYLAQKMFDDAVFGGLAEDIHDIYILKSRQLGISTEGRALDTFWLGINRGLRSAMVFDTSFNTQVSRREVEEILDNLPKRLKFPTITGRNRDAIILDNEAWLLFMQAGTKNSKAGGGLGRSVGLNYAHCSEMCSWVNVEGIKSFKQSLADGFDNRLYIWESTARGFNEWHTMWQEAKANPEAICLFIGWWAKETQRIKRGTELFERYGIDAPNKHEIARISAVKHLYGFDVTQEQLAWYRRKIDPNRELDEDDPEDSTLIQEQPWTEDEAFQQTGSLFFAGDKLTEASRRIAQLPKPQCYKFWPGIDFVTSDVKLSTTRREIELQMWEEPVSESLYIVSGDPAFGHSEDNDHTSIEVVRCFADGIDQVAEYESGTIQPHQMSWLLWTLVGYYGSRPNNLVGMICELNGPGEEVWRQYQTTQRLISGDAYLGAAAREKGIGDIFSNARSYIYQRSDSMNAGHMWQWKTNTQIKIQALEACRNYFHNGVFQVRSVDLIEQMKAVVRDGDEIGAEGRNRDDHVMSSAMAIRFWEDRFRRAMIAGNRTREAERAKRSVSIQDQWSLWQRYTFQEFFKKKETARVQAQINFRRSGQRHQQRRW